MSPLRVVVMCVAVAVTAAGRAADRDADRQMIREVADRLLAVIPADDVPARYAWPPVFELIDNPAVGTHNAFATILTDDEGQIVTDKAGRWRTLVAITPGFMDDIVAGSEDRLAMVMGHELAHLYHGHVTDDRGGTDFLKLAFGREHEYEADRTGALFTAEAGFSVREGVDMWVRLEREEGYSSFEGQATDHPATSDRIARLDEAQAELWRAMSSFRSGVDFLALEQYQSAESCFRDVVKEFPESDEGWTNLGYAQLMRYCDQLEPDDLRALDVGHLVSGGFYRRPATLESQVRGFDDELWREAVRALDEAARLNPDSALAHAHLGLAYLVKPDGADAVEARRRFKLALERLERDTELDALARAAILVNAGVADLAGGQIQLFNQRIAEAEESVRSFIAKSEIVAMQLSLEEVLLYNRAMPLSESAAPEEQARAADLLETYLQDANPASAWRVLADERYRELCRKLGRTPMDPQKLKPQRQEMLRLVTTVRWPDGGSVSLAEPLAAVRERLGAGVETPVLKGFGLVRVRFPERGLEVIADERIVAIVVAGPAAPAVTLQGAGLASGRDELSIGLGKADLDAILARQKYDYRRVLDPRKDYRFYPGLGLALRVKEGQLVEMIVATVPRKPLDLGLSR